jgi:hypothetical protein
MRHTFVCFSATSPSDKRHDTYGRYCSIVSTQPDHSLLAFRDTGRIVCTPRKLIGDKEHQMPAYRTSSLEWRFLCQEQPNGA